jgi:hypothetical protein
VFTARYALSPYIKQIRFVFKGLKRKRGCTRDTTLQGSTQKCTALRALRLYLLVLLEKDDFDEDRALGSDERKVYGDGERPVGMQQRKEVSSGTCRRQGDAKCTVRTQQRKQMSTKSKCVLLYLWGCTVR